MTEIGEGVIDQMAARFGRTLPLLPGAVEAVRRAAMAQRRTGVDRQTVDLLEFPDSGGISGTLRIAWRTQTFDVRELRGPLTALKVRPNARRTR